MEFEHLPQELQTKFVQLYKEHISACAKNLSEDHCLLPMLRIDRKLGGELISLQRSDGTYDPESALEKAKELLRDQPFEAAIFSYSSENILKRSAALATYIFDKSGAVVLYFTAYHYQGLFKKKTVYDDHILGAVSENVL